ncbi:type II toxin-antitoxin system prevent-host-death family antitoxin [Streptomyces sp. NPDC020298]|uniref:type II toxin-antitoxin system prevent-host-death family antitoxin n=1 Tax=unclassified Streptomyces TaxID=2593676 RepID=UPI0033CD026C
MPENAKNEFGVRELRANLGDVISDVAVRGRIVYVTSYGRRVAAIVPVPDAEALEAQRQAEPPES